MPHPFAGPGAGFTRPGPVSQPDCIVLLRGRGQDFCAPAPFRSRLASCFYGAGGRIYPPRPRLAAGLPHVFTGPGAGYSRPGPVIQSACFMHLRGRERDFPVPAPFRSSLASCICGARGRIYPPRPRFAAHLPHAFTGPGARFTRPGPALRSACSLTLSQPACFLFCHVKSFPGRVSPRYRSQQAFPLFMSKASRVASHPEVAANKHFLFGKVVESGQERSGKQSSPTEKRSTGLIYFAGKVTASGCPAADAPSSTSSCGK